ncbi:MAG: hypothetical protein JW839_19915 [Candidatus Lokiarchaeota archaeon]|nr:hypothetical protein [Candidatus Lokiarchaeota archaeon]
MQLQIPPEANAAVTALGVLCMLIAFVLSLVLARKYRRKRSRTILYLLVAFLLFVVAGVAAIPINIFTDYVSDKWTYMVTKVIITFAALYFIKFIVGIFAPDSEGSPRITKLSLAFVISNLAVVVLYHVLEVHIYTTTGVRFSIIWLLAGQSFGMAAPFLWLAYLASKVAARDPVIKERRAIQFIALSGLALAMFFAFNAVNEALGRPNYWTFPAWACGIVAVVCFYVGLARPAFVFRRYG